MKPVTLLISILLLFPHARCKRAGNPYSNRAQYVNPYYVSNVERTIPLLPPQERKVLEKVNNAPTSIWLTSGQSVSPSNIYPGSLLGTLSDAAKKKSSPIVTYIVYNLPNRDCNAKASLGELCCRYLPNGRCDYAGSSDCTQGLNQYRTFINQMANGMRKYCNKVPMSLVVEPDSLPNMATYLSNPRCSSKGTLMSYREGVKYAVTTLSKACKKATLYLDAAHGRWLGPGDRADRFLKEVKALGVANRIRGFATNIANFNSVGKKCPFIGYCNGNRNAKHPCCGNDPCKQRRRKNPGFNEVNFVAMLKQRVKRQIPGFNPHFIIDTSRSSAKNNPSFCSTFCNPRGVGIGVRPTTKTADRSLIDAYLWIKVPGESDGCSKRLPNGGSCPRYDFKCGSKFSIGSSRGEPRAPEAGDWFFYQVKQLARKASFEV